MSARYAQNLKAIQDWRQPLSELPRMHGEILLEEIKNSSDSENYLFKQYVAKGGEGIVIWAIDLITAENVILKILFPNDRPTAEFSVVKPVKKAVQLFLGSKKKSGDIIAFKKERNLEDKDASKKTKKMQRFRRSYYIHQEVYSMVENYVDDDGQALKKFAYTPKPYRLNSSKYMYYSMEYMDCLTLMEWVVGKSTVEKLLYFRNLVKIILSMHENGIIHCDIAPRNLLCGQYNCTPVLIDFGLSKNLKSNEQLTDYRDHTIGRDIKFSHMVQVRDFSERHYVSDVFSLGCVFWCIINEYIPDWFGNREETPIDEIFFPSDLPQSMVHIFKKSTMDIEGKYDDVLYLYRDVEELYKTYAEKTDYDSPSTNLKPIEISHEFTLEGQLLVFKEIVKERLKTIEITENMRS